MIVVHHLGTSQSDRVVWLLEELGLPYGLKWYKRTEKGTAPAQYLALHPAATAPVIEDDGTILTESAVILEYLCHTYAAGRFTLAPSDPNYANYLYWMHYNNNNLGLYFIERLYSSIKDRMPSEQIDHIIHRRARYLDYMEQCLQDTSYLGGADFTCADIMALFNLTVLPLPAERALQQLPNIRDYLERVTQRPAYIKAMEIAGPRATPPPDGV